MRLVILTIFACLAFLVPAFGAQGDVAPEGLTYLTEDYYPYNYQRNGVLQGISVDILRRVWAELGVEDQPIHLLPWARGYKFVQEVPGTVLFSMARTPEREEMFQWVGPITTARFVLSAKKGRAITIRSLEDICGYSVGTLIDDITDILLEDAKTCARVESVPDTQFLVKMLEHDRIDLLAYEEKSLQRLMWAHGYAPEDVETVYVLKETSVYFAFHPDTPPTLVERFQQAMDRVRLSPEYEQIFERHLQ
ncbi:MAG: ABC transporter substrate-binding protein [Proteobacteria bacterium]|nr:ABC transporter substrate-binding protein [Pseudomonadota bacterium]MBU1610881.1 ABC transporter substrate-binding protein [Pseudomonadota bacterium]